MRTAHNPPSPEFLDLCDRLGLLVKVANLKQLISDDPGIRRILTGNADANRYMIAINEQLSFHVSDQYRYWDLDLAADTGSARKQHSAG